MKNAQQKDAFTLSEDDLSRRFSIARRVTQPAHKFSRDLPSVVQIIGDIYNGTVSKGRGAKMRDVPAQLCTVLNMRTDTTETMTVPREIVLALASAYPMGAYKDRYFKIERHAKKALISFSCDELQLTPYSKDPPP
jgi:hypothetical protein